MILLRCLAVLAIVAAIPLGVHFAEGAARNLQALTHPSAPTPAGRQPAPRGAERHRHRRRAHAERRRATTRATSPRQTPPAARRDGGILHANPGRLLIVAGLELAGSVLAVAVVAGALTLRRARRRHTRRYGLYELRLSTHDEAKPQDLEDMIEAIAHLVCAFPVERARDGQPHIAFELICAAPANADPAVCEFEWSLNLRCEPSIVEALDAAINAAYPDVRLGREHARAPQPRPPLLGGPRHVLRFRKQRGFVYPLIAPDDALASPPLEQIALAQVALGAASIVRFQLTPAPAWFEALARRLHRRHENRLARAERWGLPESGLRSTLNRAEMHNAEQTQNRSLFWLELAVAADTIAACKTVAAAVQARRGENRLHRRYMLVRRGLYRRRFPNALAPLVPSPRALISAAETAHLLELPSARMKGVPVRRATVPRIPAPPEALRADDLDPIATPSTKPAGETAAIRALARGAA
jgi:hypothetical protein